MGVSEDMLSISWSRRHWFLFIKYLKFSRSVETQYLKVRRCRVMPCAFSLYLTHKHPHGSSAELRGLHFLVQRGRKFCPAAFPWDPLKRIQFLDSSGSQHDIPEYEDLKNTRSITCYPNRGWTLFMNDSHLHTLWGGVNWGIGAVKKAKIGWHHL